MTIPTTAAKLEEIELKRTLQRSARIAENIDRIAELERELGAKEREVVKLRQVIQSIVNLLKGAGFLRKETDMVEK
jgi:hypothetical protein